MSNKTIAHTCGHTFAVKIDTSTASWVTYHQDHPCYACRPVEEVERLCGHVEEVARGFFSPRYLETASMQLCAACRH